MMIRAIWNGAVIAESPQTVIVEGNHYFPANALRMEFFRPSQSRTQCYWKGEAEYYSVVVDGAMNKDAAWFYRSPKPAARKIAGMVAFWKGVRVVEADSTPMIAGRKHG